jgi:hypothetical protein
VFCHSGLHVDSKNKHSLVAVGVGGVAAGVQQAKQCCHYTGEQQTMEADGIIMMAGWQVLKTPCL